MSYKLNVIKPFFGLIAVISVSLGYLVIGAFFAILVALLKFFESLKPSKKKTSTNQAQIDYTSKNLIKEGATQDVTNKLLEISKVIKDERLTEAESLLRNFDKQSLNQADLTNIQSVRASLYLIRGKLPEAKAVYEAILDTQIKSNAVYIGLATISAFEAFGKRNSDPKESKKLFYQSNDWYFRAISLDNRPQILVTIYYGIYDNYRILVDFFKEEKEYDNFIKYKKLFEDCNKKIASPLKTNTKIGNNKTSLTKSELQSILKNKGLNFDISSIPGNSTIDNYSIKTDDSQNPVLIINHNNLS